MSHNLNVTNNKPSMMYVGEAPWHNLGTKLEKPATAAEAIEAAGLGFTVERAILKTEILNLPVPDHYATVRKDTMEVLGVVGSRYVPIQNKDAFSVFDSLVGERRGYVSHGRCPRQRRTNLAACEAAEFHSHKRRRHR